MFFEKALARLNDENLRSRKFLNPSSYSKVSQQCQQRLVEDYLTFLHSECKDLIKNEVKYGLYASSSNLLRMRTLLIFS